MISFFVITVTLDHIGGLMCGFGDSISGC